MLCVEQRFNQQDYSLTHLLIYNVLLKPPFCEIHPVTNNGLSYPVKLFTFYALYTVFPIIRSCIFLSVAHVDAVVYASP